MKLRVLVDNNIYIDQYYCGEPAVSYYIKDEDTSFLLDVGYSDLFSYFTRRIKAKIHEVLPIKEVGVGLEINW